MCSIAAVVFDLDDTLYPEREYAYSGFSAVAQAFADRLGNPRDTAARMRQMFDSERRPRVFHSLLAELGLEENRELIERMIDVYRTHRPTIRLFPDADIVLNELRGAFRLGLLSDGRTPTQWTKIDALGLRDRLDAILITSELGLGFAKPSPQPFDFISTRLQVVGSRSLYVADNPAKDFVAPNALGWTTVQVRRAEGLYREQTPPPGGEPKHVMESLEQLAELLQG